MKMNWMSFLSNFAKKKNLKLGDAMKPAAKEWKKLKNGISSSLKMKKGGEGDNQMDPNNMEMNEIKEGGKEMDMKEEQPKLKYGGKSRKNRKSKKSKKSKKTQKRR
jgi:hypothetical protein